MQSGGPIAWKAVCQERTALSSCKAKIRATNMGAHLTVNTRNMISSLSDLGYPIDDTTLPTPLYNNNDACMKWCHNMTTKGNSHIKNCKNSMRKWVADGTITVIHVDGKCNVSDIFTKEMQDGANFCRLRDSFMCRASNYLKGIHHLASDVNIGPSSYPATSSPVLAQSTQIVPPPRHHRRSPLLSQFAYLLRLILYLCRRSPSPVSPHTSILFADSYERSYGGCSYVGYSYRLLFTRKVVP
jgi:hypothetical protein